MQWGAWASIGMASQSAATLKRIEYSGMGLIKPVQGLEVLQKALTGSPQTAIIANPFRWDRLLQGLHWVPGVFEEYFPETMVTQIVRSLYDHE